MDLLAEQFLDAQLAGVRRDAVAVVERARLEGMSVPWIDTSIIREAQRAVGELWATDRITVAQEHVCTEIASLALSWLYPHLPRAPQNGKKVLVACVEGELHELGARVASDFFEMAGFDVRYLGANVPTTSLVEMVRGERPDLVALSIAVADHAPALEEAVGRLRHDFDGLDIVAGGSALEEKRDLARGDELEHAGWKHLTDTTLGIDVPYFAVR